PQAPRYGVESKEFLNQALISGGACLPYLFFVLALVVCWSGLFEDFKKKCSIHLFSLQCPLLFK
ncbi:MAG TPA: hypothetical protein V6D31_02055, partial [Candidatus Sericytochromatia bacterium]